MYTGGVIFARQE